MIAEIDKDGVLDIYADTIEESVLLKEWYHRNDDNEKDGARLVHHGRLSITTTGI